jgi:hypothetical protein
LKILPAVLAGNRDRMRRFIQEANPPRPSIIRISQLSTKLASMKARTSSRWNLSMARRCARKSITRAPS